MQIPHLPGRDVECSSSHRLAGASRRCKWRVNGRIAWGSGGDGGPELRDLAHSLSGQIGSGVPYGEQMCVAAGVGAMSAFSESKGDIADAMEQEVVESSPWRPVSCHSRARG